MSTMVQPESQHIGPPVSSPVVAVFRSQNPFRLLNIIEAPPPVSFCLCGLNQSISTALENKIQNFKKYQLFKN
jgi:hypothetical protein